MASAAKMSIMTNCGPSSETIMVKAGSTGYVNKRRMPDVLILCCNVVHTTLTGQPDLRARSNQLCNGTTQGALLMCTTHQLFSSSQAVLHHMLATLSNELLQLTCSKQSVSYHICTLAVLGHHAAQ